MNGMEQPIHYWVPSIAPSGMEFITSDKYKNWKGSILVGSLAFQYLERFGFRRKQSNCKRKINGWFRTGTCRKARSRRFYICRR